MSSASRRAIRRLEFVDGVVLQSLDHVADEALRVHVRDACFGIAYAHRVGDCLHQVCLAEANSAVDEKRVVRAPWIFRHLLSSGLGELVALTLDEIRKCEIRVKAATDDNCVDPLRSSSIHADGCSRQRAGADLEVDLRRL